MLAVAAAGVRLDAEAAEPAGVAAAGVEAGTEMPLPEGFELLLVGLWIGGLEVGELLVYAQDGGYWLSLEDLAFYLSVTLSREDGGLRAVTPIGSVALEPGELRMLEGREHLSPATLRDKLKTGVELDASEYALVVTPPRLGVNPPPGETGIDPEPEVRAPAHNLSRAYAELRYQGDGSTGSVTGSTPATPSTIMTTASTSTCW
jgi:hypothetical protein